MKIINLSILLSLGLVGCSSVNNDFDCPVNSGLAAQSSDRHLDLMQGEYNLTYHVLTKIRGYKEDPVPTQKEIDGEVFKGVPECRQKQKELKAKDLCVPVVSDCAEKDPITQACLEKKSRYCCFKSKLARLIQEQGRKQLGLSFGRHDHPNCRGLTVEELNQIDFEQIDLSGLFSELSQHSQSSDHRKADLRLHPSKTKGVAS